MMIGELGIYIREINYVNHRNLLFLKLTIRKIISIYNFQYKIIKRFLSKKDKVFIQSQNQINYIYGSFIRYYTDETSQIL